MCYIGDILDRFHGIKKCTKCGYVRKHRRNKAKKDGLATECDACNKKACKEHYKANRDARLAQANEYYKENRDARLAQKKVYHSKPETKQNRNARDRTRRATDPVHRTHTNLSNALRDFLKGTKNGLRTFDIVGCTSEELVEYLEQTMSPETRAALEAGEKIEVDHIVPQRAPGIDIMNDAHVRAMYHYTNFQKLDRPTNGPKNNNVPEGYDTETWVTEQHARIEACRGMTPVDTIPMNAKMLADARTFANSFRR
tara:strand:+ start:99 stop:863 length:765 start_codon:yes stop_codon:yes gene_type:complete